MSAAPPMSAIWPDPSGKRAPVRVLIITMRSDLFDIKLLPTRVTVMVFLAAVIALSCPIFMVFHQGFQIVELEDDDEDDDDDELLWLLLLLLLDEDDDDEDEEEEDEDDELLLLLDDDLWWWSLSVCKV
jgi:hypothetical protein